MKKHLLIACALLLGILPATAQDAEDTGFPQDTIGPWITKGNVSLLFNQSTFDNWLAGGEVRVMRIFTSWSVLTITS